MTRDASPPTITSQITTLRLSPYRYQWSSLPLPIYFFYPELFMSINSTLFKHWITMNWPRIIHKLCIFEKFAANSWILVWIIISMNNVGYIRLYSLFHEVERLTKRNSSKDNTTLRVLRFPLFFLLTHHLRWYQEYFCVKIFVLMNIIRLITINRIIWLPANVGTS